MATVKMSDVKEMAQHYQFLESPKSYLHLGSSRTR